MANTVVLTIGYQGRAINELLDLLCERQVDVVVDVRSKPISRRQDYSKKRLAAHLNSRGISYIHTPQLGMPIDLLDRRCEKTGNAEILSLYRDQLSSRSDVIAKVAAEAQVSNICLLCFESNPAHCHRSAVAEALLEERPLSVLHL